MSVTASVLSWLPWKLWGPVMRARWWSGGTNDFRKRNVGVYSYVDPSVQIFGWRHVTVGKHSAVSEDSWLNASARDGENDRIVIGDFCYIGRRNYFSTGGLIHIKDFGFTGIDCHFLGSGHNVESPMIPYISSGLSSGAPIQVGVNCWLTTSVTVLEGVEIGCGSVVGARSVVTGSLPPFSISIGNPCRTIKRFDFKNHVWVPAHLFSEDFLAYMPSEAEYLAELRRTWDALGPQLHASSSRFGWIR